MDMRVAPPALGLNVANRLLDLLSTDDSFRELFVKDAKAALEIAGYVHDERFPHPAMCLFIRNELASKDKISAAREKLLISVNSIQNQLTPFDEKG